VAWAMASSPTPYRTLHFFTLGTPFADKQLKPKLNTPHHVSVHPTMNEHHSGAYQEGQPKFTSTPGLLSEEQLEEERE
jgi:hypothetical protein